MLQLIKKDLFGSLEFDSISHNSEFKEDSVRELIIAPIIKALGFSNEQVVRSKILQHPFLKIGSNKNIPIKLIPDYCIKINDNYAWVLDAKAPTQSITDSQHIEQVYSYASHPEIRSIYFALCNGVEFSLYRRESTNEPILFFKLSEIEFYWDKLFSLLSPNSFQLGKQFLYGDSRSFQVNQEFDYSKLALLSEIPVRKQLAKRHFGVHGYFTRQAWNVVAEYIRRFSQPGDLILDPFSGSGVTAIEALMNDRKAINVDINPMSTFMVEALAAPVNTNELIEAFDNIKQSYLKDEPNSKEEIDIALAKYSYPKGIKLPKGSDVPQIEKLFTKKQLAQLAFLKSLIIKVKDENIRKSLLIAFSSSINKYNRTFHYTNSAGGGDSGPFRYYRYRIAPKPGKLDLMDIYETKLKRLIAAKKEIQYKINSSTINNLKVIKGNAADLNWLENESVDYIYTDPPYGKKIQYLDLSIMWNAWLDFEVSEDDYANEAIEGGEHNKSKNEYNDLIAKSIQEMYRVLKFDHWLSFVFAHKDPEFWHLIIDTAEKCGFEYIGATPQKNGQSSFKKRQNPFTVLSGQLMINFRKTRTPKAIMKASLGMDIGEIVFQTIEGIIAKNQGATLEQINDELIIKGLELGFLDLLKKQYSDLTPILLGNFDYNSSAEIFTIKKETRFKTNIDVKLRIRYYLISYLRRKERENENPTFDDIILNIIPLLKNGVTPENQTVLSVLEDIAEHIGENKWRLLSDGEQKLF